VTVRLDTRQESAWEHTLTLALADATVDQLRSALFDAQQSATACERQGSFLHTWHSRAKAIRAELERRGAA
jgi:hypothetical protein